MEKSEARQVLKALRPRPPISPLYLAYISPTSRPYLAHISPVGTQVLKALRAENGVLQRQQGGKAEKLRELEV